MPQRRQRVLRDSAAWERTANVRFGLRLLGELSNLDISDV